MMEDNIQKTLKTSGQNQPKVIVPKRAGVLTAKGNGVFFFFFVTFDFIQCLYNVLRCLFFLPFFFFCQYLLMKILFFHILFLTSFFVFQSLFFVTNARN